MANSIRKILRQKSSYAVRGSLWIESDKDRFFGPGRVELLLAIADHGSISKAARKMGMSYKKAWTMIDSLNGQTSEPVVIRQTGGKKGGGCTLTPEAFRLIEYHRHLRTRFAKFLEKETARLKA